MDTSKPWENEPNQRAWIDEETGLRCMILRTPLTGTLCGYVRLPRGHKFTRRGNYSSRRSRRYSQYGDGLMRLSVHGGITFHGRPRRLTGGNVRGTWIGFDCAHYMDYMPNLDFILPPFIGRLSGNGDMAKHSKAINGTYRTFDYVTKEVEHLARQVRASDKHKARKK